MGWRDDPVVTAQASGGGWKSDPIVSAAPAVSAADPVSAARQAGRDVVTGADMDSRNNSFTNDLVRNARATAATALNGVTFGWGDELAGAIAGGIAKLTGAKYDDAYQQARDYVRGVVDQQRQSNPIAAAGGEIGGSVLTAPLAVLNAVGKGGALARAAYTAGTGAAMGGVQGAGEADTMEEVPQKAATGAAVGGALSAVMPAAGTVLKGARDQIAPRMSGNRAYELALRRVGLALVRDEKTGEIVVKRLQELGPEATIADAAGKSTRDMLDTMATLPGKTGDRLETLIEQRIAGRPERMDPMTKALNPSGIAANDAAAAFQAMKDSAAPLYAKVEGAPIQINERLAEIAQRPDMMRAMEKARVLAGNEGRPFAGDVPTTLRDWDYAKQALDDTIERLLKNNANNEARAVVGMKNELLRELDGQTGGAYKAARDAFAGPAAMESAMTAGNKALSMSGAQIAVETFGLSASEMMAFRLGAAEALRQKVGRQAGQTEIMNLWKNRELRDTLGAIYGSEAEFAKAQQLISNEATLKKLESAGRGSQTASREARVEDLNAGVAEDVLHAGTAALTKNPFGVITAARSLGGRLGTPEAVRDEIGRILMLRGPEAEQQLQKLFHTIRAMQEGNSRAAAIEGVLGSSLINP